jgi:hypothetical protein
LIGFTPIDEQVKISQELRVMFKYFAIVGGFEFGMVAAAIHSKVDCVGYISHLIILIRAYCSSAGAPFSQSQN